MEALSVLESSSWMVLGPLQIQELSYHPQGTDEGPCPQTHHCCPLGPKVNKPTVRYIMLSISKWPIIINSLEGSTRKKIEDVYQIQFTPNTEPYFAQFTPYVENTGFSMYS